MIHLLNHATDVKSVKKTLVYIYLNYDKNVFHK